MLQTRWQLAGLLIGVAIVCGAVGDAAAQGKKPFEKHDGTALYYSLKDVINTGAKLYNDNGDHVGCYRMYQGALISVRPFLAPDLQRKIDDSIAGCDGMASYADRSFALRKVLDEIRERVKPAGLVVDQGDGQVGGKLNFEGKAVADGYSVTLISGDKKFTAPVEKDGSFHFKNPIPVGEYRIAITPREGKSPPLPQRYLSETTSGLAIRVQPGKQHVDLNLVK